MSDLISREALLVVPNVRKVVEYDETGEYITYFAVPEDAIKDAPAVDAEPVRHSKWVEDPDRRNHWHCRECGLTVGRFHSTYGYCYNCGAKMDEEV